MSLLAMMTPVADTIHGIVSNHERDPALRYKKDSTLSILVFLSFF